MRRLGFLAGARPSWASVPGRAALSILLGGLGALSVTLQAEKSDAPGFFRYRRGESWKLEDTVWAQVPDPQTGQALTPTTRGLFQYRVSRLLPDGSVVLGAKVLSLKAGTSFARLTPIPIERPEKPEQYMVLAQNGSVYGPYTDAGDKAALEAAKGLDEWVAAKKQSPWLWYKIPAEPLEVGKSVTRQLGRESWAITREKDEVVNGLPCRVYSAKLEQGRQKVTETTWYYTEGGYPVKREILEKRKEVSSTLTQLRLKA